MPRKHLFLILCFFFFLSPADAQNDAPGLEESRALYEKTLSEMEETATEKENAALLQYAVALARVRRATQEAGDLDGVLLVTDEQARAREGRELNDLENRTLPEGLARARANHAENLGRIDREHQENVTRLRQSYLAHLQRMQRVHTINNQIEEALAFREEQRRVEAKVPLPPPAPDRAPPSADDSELFALVWQRGMPANQVRVRRGDQSEIHEVKHEGDNRMTPRGFETRGGISRIPSLNEPLKNALQASNELTLVAFLQTENLNQRGPARILTFSGGTQNLNFSLGQENNSLVMRLRTQNTDRRGDPQIPLGEILENNLIRVVFTYRPGEPRAFVDGEEVELPDRTGDFRVWEDLHLIFGDEHTGERPWRGEIQAFQIFNRVMDPERAINLSSGR
ncbi:MAG: LamG domain-containing protein [Verrucomicrobia bacterium]|nr:LamG domain-containing protein [Verrucomicrobiota bacterium]MCH8511041.1 LamG domain-containing protein [Kiritimatiellia bacterium]